MVEILEFLLLHFCVNVILSECEGSRRIMTGLAFSPPGHEACRTVPLQLYRGIKRGNILRVVLHIIIGITVKVFVFSLDGKPVVKLESYS